MTTYRTASFFARTIDAMLTEVEALANAAAYVQDTALETELRAMYAQGKRASNVAAGKPANGDELATDEFPAVTS